MLVSKCAKREALLAEAALSAALGNFWELSPLHLEALGRFPRTKGKRGAHPSDLGSPPPHPQETARGEGLRWLFALLRL